MHLPEVKLIGSRIYLRKLGLNDVTEVYCGWLNDTEVNQFLDTKSATTESIRAYIEEKNKQNNTLLLGIFMRDGDRHIGTIKLDPIDVYLYKATISIMIGDKTYWGKGFGGEAIGLLSKYAFLTLGLSEIWLGLQRANSAAMRAYAKLGFLEVPLLPTDPRLAYDPHLYNEVNMVLKCSDPSV